MMDDDTEAYDDRGPEEPAALDTEAEVTCPHCGATVSLTLDPAGGRAQDYVEDCEGCCRPWRARPWDGTTGGADGEVQAENAIIRHAPALPCRPLELGA